MALCRPLLTAGLLVLGLTARAENRRPLIIEADTWCPYNCVPQSAQPGYIIELMRHVFSPRGIDIVYRSAPWTRALHNTEMGRSHAAIAASAEQARKSRLLIGREAIAVMVECLYVRASDPRRYQRPGDLAQFRRIGTVAGYLYQHDMGKWVRNPAHHAQIDALIGDQTGERNARKLVMGRVDAAIETRAVMAYALRQTGLQGQVREAGCQPSTPLYMAFTPRLADAADLVAQLDSGIVQARRNGKLAEILARYGLRDWQ